MTVEVIHGDCLDVLADMAANTVDSIVTDPPCEIGFMGKGWDGSGIAYRVELWAECLRVLKPGGHLLAFGGTRTYHRMTVAIEDAGFDIRDSLHWLYGSGFPKSLDVSKAIDKAAGAERDVVGIRTLSGRAAQSIKDKGGTYTAGAQSSAGLTKDVDITAPATDAARQWAGFGTALKPAHEPIVVARKPLTGTVAANVLTHGTGALNIDGCRVAGALEGDPNRFAKTDGGTFAAFTDAPVVRTAGRWPANLVLTHAHNCEQVSPGASTSTPAEEVAGGIWQPSEGKPAGPTYDDTPSVWRCADGCPVAELDRQSGALKPATSRTKRGNRSPFTTGTSDLKRDQVYQDGGGGASRFFTTTEWDPTADVAPFRYVAEPSKRERNAGLDGLAAQFAPTMNDGIGAKPHNAETATPKQNHHPTVKPVALMRWLVRLVTPPGGTVLDPFAGSGTTLVAATLEGFDAIGIEMTDDYLPIIAGRVAWAEAQPDKVTHAEPTLFDVEAER